jgi:ribose transport system substrate-binding protein
VRRPTTSGRLLLTGCVALTLALASGCVTSSASDSPSSGAKIDVGSGSITPRKMKSIAVLFNNDTSATFTQSMFDAGTAMAAKQGVTLDFKYAHLDAPTELANYQSVVAGGKYDGMIIQPLAQQLCSPVQRDAAKANLAVVVIVSPNCGNADATGDGLWSPGTLSYVAGMNDRDHTVTLMQSAAKNSPGPQHVMLVLGTQTLPNTVSFEAGYRDYLKTNPAWTDVTTVYTDFSAPDALKKTQAALQGHNDVSMIFTSYAGITDGVVQAIAAQNQTGKIAVYDQTAGSKRSAALLENGQLTGTLPSYPASIMQAAIQTLIDAGNGTTPPRFVDNDGNPQAAKSAVTKADVATLDPQY